MLKNHLYKICVQGLYRQENLNFLDAVFSTTLEYQFFVTIFCCFLSTISGTVDITALANFYIY